MENKKISFFQKLKISIFNLEKYGIFISEKLSTSIRYLIILVAMFTLIEAGITTFDNIKLINKGLKYLQYEMPDFNVENGQFISEDIIDGFDEEYDFKIISKDTDVISDSELKEFDKFSNYIILLKDRMIINLNGTYDEIGYNIIKESLNADSFNKQTFINVFNSLGGNIGISAILAVTSFITFFIINFIEIATTTILVAVFGYFVARINRIKIKYNTAGTLAIYSLTLSIILNILYVVQLYFTGFEIQYFDLLFIAIAYIYIVAAILIIKSDLIKQMIEVGLIEQIQKKIIQEQLKPNEEKPEEDKNDNKEKKKEKKEKDEGNIDKEPDGSEI